MLKLRTPHGLGLTIVSGVCSVVLWAGCGGAKPSAKPDAGSDTMKMSGGEGGGDTPEPGGDASTPADASAPPDDAGIDAPPPPKYEGIPFEDITDKAPKGCVSKAPAGDTLTLTLDTTVKAVQLGMFEGQLFANGSPCDLGSAATIKVTGSAGAETVIIDLSQGQFPAAVLSAKGGIVIDVAGGKDTVAVMGSMENDRIVLGTKDGKTMFDAGAMAPKISVANNEKLIVSSGPGDDRIEASGSPSTGAALAVNLIAWGGEGSDALSGGAKDDELHGGLGDDSFETAAKPDGADLYEGGPDVDTLSYALRTAAVIVKINNSPDDGEAGERDNVQTSTENLTGGSAADNFTGSDGANTFIGGPGNDTLNGGAGDDVFLEVEAAAGSDIMNGGDGSDTIDYSGRKVDLSVTLCTSAQLTCFSGACGCAADDGEASEKDTLVNMENAFSGSGNDMLMGNANANFITGGMGNDVLRGFDGDDNLYGEFGNDALEGGDGDDLLDGAEGSDTFDGGGGDGDICVLQPKETQKNCELH